MDEQLSFDFGAPLPDPYRKVAALKAAAEKASSIRPMYWSINFTHAGVNIAFNGETLSSLEAAVNGIRESGVFA